MGFWPPADGYFRMTFYQSPMRPFRIHEPSDHPDWLFEVKMDGELETGARRSYNGRFRPSTGLVCRTLSDDEPLLPYSVQHFPNLRSNDFPCRLCFLNECTEIILFVHILE